MGKNNGKYGKIWESYDNPIGIGGTLFIALFFRQTHLLAWDQDDFLYEWGHEGLSISRVTGSLSVPFGYGSKLKQRTTARLGTFLGCAIQFLEPQF